MSKFDGYPEKIFDYYESIGEKKNFITSSGDIDIFIKYIKLCQRHDEDFDNFIYYKIGTMMECSRNFMKWDFEHNLEEPYDGNVNELIEFCDHMSKMCHEYYDYLSSGTGCIHEAHQMEFDGDIIITDPCYLDCDDHFDEMRIIQDSTIYGDWSCTTYETNDRPYRFIGQFCADSGMVCVALLSDVLKYNPEFDYHVNRQWTTTLIKDFKGTAMINFKYDDDNYCECFVEGHGINKVTGEKIDFITWQTGY